jgi:hypothetical protein
MGRLNHPGGRASSGHACAMTAEARDHDVREGIFTLLDKVDELEKLNAELLATMSNDEVIRRLEAIERRLEGIDVKLDYLLQDVFNCPGELVYLQGDPAAASTLEALPPTP